ncbi:MAG: LysM peptidoglycan-binding domain-containing protein [Elusimicrobiota bacterium]|nr:LysM peptidoglycan-binding domain-containing protein [Elusimicrobiota bacterium]
MRRITRLHMILVLIVLAAIGLFIAEYRVRRREVIPSTKIPPAISKVVPALPVPAKPSVIPSIPAEKPKLDLEKQKELSRKAIAVAGEYWKIAREEGRAFEEGQEILKRAKKYFSDGNYEEAIKLAKEAIAEFKKARIFGIKYKVHKTDCLWKIARMKKHYSRGSKWGKIWWANKKTIKHYRLIYPKQTLFIPGVKRKADG